ncbi:MAG: thioredoxin family protein [Gammaproteobacteria bacterium]|nr:thioredoxin family protein [Gammaproteobacteria bacterium]
MALLMFAFPLVEASRASENTIDYSQGDIKKALGEGKTVFVDYAADWCGTCKRQERVINKLRSENPAYNKQITFVRVDWDLFRGDEVTTSRNIPRRSTLLVLKGKKELGRIVAGTSESDIKALMDLGLAN